MAHHGKPVPASVTSSLMHEHMLNQTFVDHHSPCAPITDTNAPVDIREDGVIDPRAYQLEMLEESIKRNIIVAVYPPPTGTTISLLQTIVPDEYWKW